MTSNVASSGGRQAAALLVAAGALTLVNNYLPGSEHLDIAALNLIGATAVLLGCVSWLVPWGRFPLWASLVHVPAALALIATANLLGGVSAYSFAVYFVVLFVWVGLAHPPGTAWLLMPVTAFAYVAPLLARDDVPAGGVSSVTVALPVCVLVAETISRSTRRRRVAQEEATRRAQLSELLAEVVADINGALDDPDKSIGRICDGVRRLVGCHGASFAAIEGDAARIVAVSGLPAWMVAWHYPIAGTSIEQVLATGRPVSMRDVDYLRGRMPQLPDIVPGLQELITVPAVAGGELRGVLYAVIGAERAPLDQAESDVLQALAGHVGAAMRNAAMYAEVVRQRAHEQAVVDGMADGMAVIGGDGNVRTWNAAAERLTGIPAVHAVGRPLPLALGAGGMSRGPEDRWLEAISSPLHDGELVVGIRDVTKAKALDEAKDLFLATTSHELRTPLTVVKGFTETLLSRWDQLSGELREESLHAISQRTDALIELVDHLLLGAKAGASRDALAVVPLALGPALHEAARQAGATSDRHTITVDCPAALAVDADVAALAHVLGQLLENAVKYSPDGGPVTIVARGRGGLVEVSVLDRGTGLVPGTEQRVFERFVQGHAGDRRPFGGVGLGLHIVRTLVEAMGGTVSAASRPGSGAMFSFRLPAATLPAGLPSPRAAADTDRATAS